MNRREAIMSTGGMVVAASLSALACAAQNAIAAGAASPSPPVGGAGKPPVGGAAGAVDAALDCTKKGLACRAHCLGMLSGGDTTMAECIAATEDMLAAVQALASIAAAGSKHVASAARLAIDVCTDCEAACRKHGEQHVVCRECAESCAATIAACKALV